MIMLSCLWLFDELSSIWFSEKSLNVPNYSAISLSKAVELMKAQKDIRKQATYWKWIEIVRNQWKFEGVSKTQTCKINHFKSNIRIICDSAWFQNVEAFENSMKLNSWEFVDSWISPKVCKSDMKTAVLNVKNAQLCGLYPKGCSLGQPCERFADTTCQSSTMCGAHFLRLWLVLGGSWTHKQNGRRFVRKLVMHLELQKHADPSEFTRSGSKWKTCRSCQYLTIGQGAFEMEYL